MSSSSMQSRLTRKPSFYFSTRAFLDPILWPTSPHKNLLCQFFGSSVFTWQLAEAASLIGHRRVPGPQTALKQSPSV